MGLRLNGSTSGYVELNAPAIAGTTNLTLPLLGFGKVLQVISSSNGTEVTSSTNTFIDTGLSATITPLSASSKILVFANQSGVAKFNSNTWVALRLVRNSTVLTLIEQNAARTDSSAFNCIGGCSISWLDSPSSTSALTYKTTFCSANNSATAIVNLNSSVSTITLMEIAA